DDLHSFWGPPQSCDPWLGSRNMLDQFQDSGAVVRRGLFRRLFLARGSGDVLAAAELARRDLRRDLRHASLYALRNAFLHRGVHWMRRRWRRGCLGLGIVNFRPRRHTRHLNFALEVDLRGLSLVNQIKGLLGLLRLKL